MTQIEHFQNAYAGLRL